MLLAENFKDRNCPNKDVLPCKGQTAPAEVNQARQPLGRRAGERRSRLKGYGKP